MLLCFHAAGMIVEEGLFPKRVLLEAEGTTLGEKLYREPQLHRILDGNPRRQQAHIWSNTNGTCTLVRWELNVANTLSGLDDLARVSFILELGQYVAELGFAMASDNWVLRTYAHPHVFEGSRPEIPTLHFLKDFNPGLPPVILTAQEGREYEEEHGEPRGPSRHERDFEID